jgi:hypothetical protein
MYWISEATGEEIKKSVCLKEGKQVFKTGTDVRAFDHTGGGL